MSSTAFISYRRDDSESEAGRLADTIGDQFGGGSVFFDTLDVPLGDPWPKRLLGELDRAAVVVAVIGPDWILARDEWGKRRIDDPDDWVRREIELSLVGGKVLVPLLVRHARPIPEHALPPEIGDLSSRQAYPIRNGQWRQDVQYVLSQLEPHLGSRSGDAPVPELGPDDAEPPAAAANDLRALADGFDSRDRAVRVDTAKQIAEIAPHLVLEDVLGFCRVRKTSERMAGAIALGIHIRSSSDLEADARVHGALRQLLQDRSSLVRYRAAEVLRKSPGLVPTYEEELERLAVSDGNMYVREMAAKALRHAKP